MFIGSVVLPCVFSHSPHKFGFHYAILNFFFSLIAQVSHPCDKAGNAKVLYIFSLVCLWTQEEF